MNGRERIMLVLKGELPDRVPVSPFVQEEFLYYFYPGKKSDRVKSAVECAEYFGFDIMTRSKEFEVVPYFMQKSFPNWELTVNTSQKENIIYKTYEIKTPLKTLRQVEAAPDTGTGGVGVSYSTMEYMIKDDSDLEAFIKYVPDIDAETVNHMKEYCSWSKEVIGDKGISVPWIWGGVYNKAAWLRNIEELMMDTYDNLDFYKTFMGKMADLQVQASSALALANGDAIGIQGNIANSGMMSKAFFDEHVLPYEKKVVDAIHQAGSFTVYHNCGKAAKFQTSYVDMGLTAWETVAEAPQGDNTLEAAKKNVGDKLTLIGNLDQINFLKTATVKEIEDKVEQIVNIGKPGGRYIFACSDFLEKNTPEENIHAAIRAAIHFGKY